MATNKKRGRSREEHIKGLQETFDSFAHAEYGKVNIRFYDQEGAVQAVLDAALGDREAFHTARLIKKMMEDARGHDIPCFLCGKMQHDWPILMVMTAQQSAKGHALGGIVGECCVGSTAQMFRRALAVVNNLLGESGCATPWQGHEPGHA